MFVLIIRVVVGFGIYIIAGFFVVIVGVVVSEFEVVVGCLVGFYGGLECVDVDSG